MDFQDFRFSIIIITLNEAENLPHLLDDLCAQTRRDFEVIVVDSASSDATLAIAAQYQDKLDLKCVAMQHRGTSLGRNTGAEHAQYERLLFLDADVRLQRNFLADCIGYLQRKPLLVGGGRIRSSVPDIRYRWGVKLFDWGMLATQYFFPTCTGACIISSQTVHQAIGGFDTRLTLCEDCDYVKRASRTFKFRMLPVFFEFNIRRLEQDGLIKLGYTYLKANVLRFFRGELLNDEIDYPFGHYTSPKNNGK